MEMVHFPEILLILTMFIQANELAASFDIRKLKNNEMPLSSIFNVAYGEQTTLNELFLILKINLEKYDDRIKKINPIYGPKSTRRCTAFIS